MNSAVIESPTKAPLPYIPTYQRIGCLAAFESFAQFTHYFDDILENLDNFIKSSDTINNDGEAHLDENIQVI